MLENLFIFHIVFCHIYQLDSFLQCKLCLITSDEKKSYRKPTECCIFYIHVASRSILMLQELRTLQSESGNDVPNDESERVRTVSLRQTRHMAGDTDRTGDRPGHPGHDGHLPEESDNDRHCTHT